jgi:hypothetical protein
MYKANFSFFSFACPSLQACKSMPRTDELARPQANACKPKSKRGNASKSLKKSVKKFALIHYLDNLEIKCLILKKMIKLNSKNFKSIFNFFRGNLKNHTWGSVAITCDWRSQDE